MSIRIGIYDFFAYTVPGGLFLLLSSFKLYNWDWNKLQGLSGELTPGQYLLLVVAAYLIGYVSDPVLRKWDTRPFVKVNDSAIALAHLKENHPHLRIELNAADWPIWFASIRRENLDLALEIDRWMALGKMLRGVSFFLFLIGVAVFYYLLCGNISLWHLLTVLVLEFLSWKTLLHAVSFKRRFFQLVFETVLARQEPFNGSGLSEKDPTVENAKKAS